MEICTWKTLQIKFFVYLVNCNILCYLLDKLLIYLLLGYLLLITSVIRI